MKTIILSPPRIFYCEECKIYFQSDEYKTYNSLNVYEDCPQCLEEIQGGMHDAQIFNSLIK